VAPTIAQRFTHEPWKPKRPASRGLYQIPLPGFGAWTSSRALPEDAASKATPQTFIDPPDSPNGACRNKAPRTALSLTGSAY